MMGVLGFCLFFLLGTVFATFGNSPIAAAGAYIAASICLLAHAIVSASASLSAAVRPPEPSAPPEPSEH